MKTISIFILIALLLPNLLIYSQVTNGTNTPGPGTEFVGWNGGGTSKDLDIQNQHGSKNINFFTTGSSTTQKVIILGSTGSDDGFVGIGTTGPQNLLHLHVAASSTPVFAQFTNAATGSTSTDGLLVGVDHIGVAQLIQQEAKDMRFFTTNSTVGPELRVNISEAGATFPAQFYTGTTRVGIGYGGPAGTTSFAPQAMLHIGAPGGVWRDWMDVGTYMGSINGPSDAFGQDMMYSGLYHTTIGNDAVLAWGGGGACIDDPSPTHYFRILSMDQSPCSDGGQVTDGREVVRIIPKGYVGIGDFTTGDPLYGLDVKGTADIRTVANDNTLTEVTATFQV
ncbi:MAG: hypothetical protein JWO06_2346 [Bacteroidota bacterium]|nr:hypothetical protein [Bacteroidota bacterium]